MKKIVLIICVVISFTGIAQMNSLVYLKNGSAIRGEVTKNDSTGVSIRTKDGSYWNFRADEVSSVEKFNMEVKDKGFYNRTSLGVLGGDFAGASLRVVQGYSFNRHWETGFG